ncbi:ORF32 [Lymantria xylina nucleopolyhedrovirus]|uniref:ORF32 n=1 Tax=Lymantria xylina multiple nucleopolyhedrovirus TaxID=2847840 RepID=D4N269_9ABAC|nr:ORF32 [Lymantria xylina nucleopolyhedrovirus]ADD73741.1 ORF32 [Lymantria xylina nucleopolyhedrovirus]
MAEYSSDKLLKNMPFSTKNPYSINQHLSLMSLARGEICNRVAHESIDELKSLNFDVDPLTDRIKNIFDYELYVPTDEHGRDDGTLMHVLDSATKSFVGALEISVLPKHRLALKVIKRNSDVAA